jgi:hypothetical protein
MTHTQLPGLRITKLISIDSAILPENRALVKLVAFLDIHLLFHLDISFIAARILRISDPAVCAEFVAYGDFTRVGVAEALVAGLTVAAYGGAGYESVARG